MDRRASRCVTVAGRGPAGTGRRQPPLQRLARRSCSGCSLRRPAGRSCATPRSCCSRRWPIACWRRPAPASTACSASTPPSMRATTRLLTLPPGAFRPPPQGHVDRGAPPRSAPRRWTSALPGGVRRPRPGRLRAPPEDAPQRPPTSRPRHWARTPRSSSRAAGVDPRPPTGRSDPGRLRGARSRCAIVVARSSLTHPGFRAIPVARPSGIRKGPSNRVQAPPGLARTGRAG